MVATSIGIPRKGGRDHDTICKLVQITNLTHRELKPKLLSIGENIGTVIISMPTQSINIPMKRRRSIMINMPHEPKPKSVQSIPDLKAKRSQTVYYRVVQN